MSEAEPLYSISFTKPLGLAHLDWRAGTAAMTDEDFRETLEVFAEAALQHKASQLVIDVRLFRHRPSKEILAWRDEVTVAKYNRAGVRRLAWIWPGDVPSMKPSSLKKTYEDRYFASEDEALAWVTS